MNTDGYALGISESRLRLAASSAARRCQHQPENCLQACAANAVRYEICPCLHCSPEILGALEHNFRTQVRQS